MANTLLHNVENRISDIQFQLQYILEPIEKKRVELKRRSWLLFFAFVLSLLIMAGIYYYTLNYIVLFGSGVALILYGLTYFFWINSHKTQLVDDYHKNVVPHIINEFLGEAYFNPGNSIDSNDYWNSGIFNSRVDRYNGDNYISGVLGETSLKFSTLHTQYKTQTRTKNGTKTTWHTIFKGIFVIADSNKDFKGEVYIFPDSAERLLGGIGRWLQEKVGSSGRGEMVYLEDPIFEKKYVVYATDPVEARYLLTPTMQQHFVKAADYLGTSAVHASFVNGKLHIAISGSYDLFRFKMKRCLTDADTIKYYAHDMLHVLSVIEILDLNTRIWGR